MSDEPIDGTGEDTPQAEGTPPTEAAAEDTKANGGENPRSEFKLEPTAVREAAQQLSGKVREVLEHAATTLAEQVKATAELQAKRTSGEVVEVTETSASTADAGSEAAGTETGDGNADVVNLAAERLKRRGLQQSVDLGVLLKDTFARYVTEQGVSAEEGDEGKKKVTIDGEFLTKHGAGLVPALVGGIAQAFFGAPKPDASPSTSAPASDEAAEDGATSPGTPPPEPSSESVEDATQGQTVTTSDALQVSFDVKSLLGLLFTSATKGLAASAAASATKEPVVKVVPEPAESVEDEPAASDEGEGDKGEGEGEGDEG